MAAATLTIDAARAPPTNALAPTTSVRSSAGVGAPMCWRTGTSPARSPAVRARPSRVPVVVAEPGSGRRRIP